MIVLNELTPYSDEAGNVIEYDGPALKGVRITFRGSNNRMVVARRAKLEQLRVTFDCDNGLLRIGGHRSAPAFRATIRVGQDCRVIVSRNVSATGPCVISTAEGTTVRIGRDVMMATGVQLRADDGHPIFDVRTGKRVNRSRSITVGDHVWLGFGAALLAGARVAEGSVVGMGSIVTGSIPNNCVAVGVPARVVRRDVAWERPHLSFKKPYYKPDASAVEKSPYWNLTQDVEAGTLSPPAGKPSRVGRRRRIRIGSWFTNRSPS